ncbi:MAG: hypothetical protein U1D30_03170 [Planctomycetota bacterium]
MNVHPRLFCRLWIVTVASLALCAGAALAQPEPPATTSSEPPKEQKADVPPAEPNPKVPEGFAIELLFRAPDIEHPSVVTCDDKGNLFVGEDPMDMRGPTTEEKDRILFLRWDPNGGPPTKTVFCDKLSAVFGMVWHQGKLYVMHAPHYSMFEDTDGDGVADVRKDLAEGFGPPAGIHGFNDHIVTGTRRGLDGLVYVSVGDKGIQKATGADGSTISLEGGGVVRMRLDGTQLEVFSSGTRNHLDVAMDALDNIFTYDNTDDGLGWWTRFTHHVPTGYYGYPYDYHPHPDRHLPRISEHGGGSPVGADCYREAVWPEKYRNTPFFCEWGKGKIQCFHVRPQGATFTAEIEDFMTREGWGEFRPQTFVSVRMEGTCTSRIEFRRLDAAQSCGATLSRHLCRRLPPCQRPSWPTMPSLRICCVPWTIPLTQRVLAQDRLALLKEAAIEPLRQIVTGKEQPNRDDSCTLGTERIDGPPSRLQSRGRLAEAPRRCKSRSPCPSGSGARHAARGGVGKSTRENVARSRSHRPFTIRRRVGENGIQTECSRRCSPRQGESDPFARFTMVQAVRDRRLASCVAIAPFPRSARPNHDFARATGVYDEHAVAVLRQWSYESPDAGERAQALASIGEVHRCADLKGRLVGNPTGEGEARPAGKERLARDGGGPGVVG